MASVFEERVESFQDRLRQANLDGALITDPDSIYWLSGYWGYASLVSCGRPNIIWVPANDEPEIITPSMELEMCRNLSPFSAVRHWINGQDGEWKKQLTDIADRANPKRIGLDRARTPGIVLASLSIIAQPFSSRTSPRRSDRCGSSKRRRRLRSCARLAKSRSRWSKPGGRQSEKVFRNTKFRLQLSRLGLGRPLNCWQERPIGNSTRQ